MLKNGDASILVVDDVPVNSDILVCLLQEQNFNVRVAQSGQIALREIKKRPPDLILLDIMMPGIDGYDTCRRIKHDPVSSDIPIIFVTALNGLHDKVTGFEAGGVDFITKPFEAQEVLVRVRAQLGIQEKYKHIARRNRELECALGRESSITGFVSICSKCKKVRTTNGGWQHIECYMSERTGAIFSHGYCPVCLENEKEKFRQTV